MITSRPSLNLQSTLDVKLYTPDCAVSACSFNLNSEISPLLQKNEYIKHIAEITEHMYVIIQLNPKICTQNLLVTITSSIIIII